MAKKKPTISKLKKDLDKVFSQYVRLASADHRGVCTCFTCGAEKHWKEIQAGHFMSRKHSATRWHLDNVKPQCVKCNMFSQGEQYRFGQELGDDTAKEMEHLSKTTMKLNISDLQDEILKYKKKLKDLTG
jgi:hypothetical protein